MADHSKELQTVMVPFFTLVGDRAFEEMRTAVVPEGEALPAGPYGFLELFCADPDCDCRRVVFQVIRPDSGTTVWATINFGWESEEFYRRWSPHSDLFDEMASALLEPFGPQTEHSSELLRLCREVLLGDSRFVDRLKKHYREAKAAVRAT